MGKKRIGRGNPTWRGGAITKEGYIRPMINHKRVFEHRLVMEKVIGRPLKKYERIHHKNGIKGDNRPKNLEIVVYKKHFGRIACPFCLKSFLIK